MGLDQFAGRHTWRKHARLQKFMAVMHREQNPDMKNTTAVVFLVLDLMVEMYQ